MQYNSGCQCFKLPIERSNLVEYKNGKGENDSAYGKVDLMSWGAVE